MGVVFLGYMSRSRCSVVVVWGCEMRGILVGVSVVLVYWGVVWCRVVGIVFLGYMSRSRCIVGVVWCCVMWCRYCGIVK